MLLLQITQVNNMTNNTSTFATVQIDTNSTLVNSGTIKNDYQIVRKQQHYYT